MQVRGVFYKGGRFGRKKTVEINGESTCVFFYRYRKVVGDVCTDLLGSQFLAGHVPCPPVVPEGLGMPIMGGPSAVFLTNSNITFVITQQLVRHSQRPPA